MVDRLRSYRRWRNRRLGVLGPAFAAALAAGGWIAWGVECVAWLRLALLAVAAGGLALTGAVLIDTFRCAAFLARRDGPGARRLRTRLSSYRGLALAALAALAAALFTPHLASFHPPRRSRPDFPEARIASRALAFPEPGPPQILPVREDLPLALEVDDTRFELPVAASPPAAAPAPAPPESAETLRFRPEGLDDLLRTASRPGIDRAGLPDGSEPGEQPSPSAEFQVLLLFLKDFEPGAGLEATFDLPLGPRTSIEAALLAAGFEKEEGFFEGNPDILWQQFRLAVTHRVAGYVRRAAFDLGLAAGVALDQVAVSGSADAPANDRRMSPYVAIEIGVWEAEGWGLILRASQSYPIRRNGLGAAVTDVAAQLRIDLGERISLQAGYRLFQVRLFEGGEPEGFEADLAGPTASLELRF